MAAVEMPRNSQGSVGLSGLNARSSRRILKNFNPNAPPPPSVVLQPLNDSFVLKRFDLLEPVKIGRQTGVKSSPTEANGYFDSKVLSRAHAEILADNGKVFVKDVKSSNGTFLNSQRLSSEGEESEPHELHSGDVLDFGIDILSDDGSVLYKKASCRVSIMEMEFPQGPAASNVPPGVNSGREPANAPPPVPERPNEHTMRSLNLDAIYGQLQTDLRKSKEAAADLKQAKLVLGKIPNQTADAKDLEKKLADATEKVTRVLNEYNQVQRSLVEYKQTAAAEREKLIEEKNGFRAERDRAKEEVLSLNAQIRQMSEKHVVEMKEREEKASKADKADAQRDGETEMLKAQLAEVSVKLEKALAQSRKSVQKVGKKKLQSAGVGESGRMEEEDRIAREFQRKEVEWTARLEGFQERLARLQEANEAFDVRNNSLETEIITLGKEKALLAKSSGVDKAVAGAATLPKVKGKAAHVQLHEGGFARIFGGRLLSIPVIGISITAGALTMWMLGTLFPLPDPHSVTSGAGNIFSGAAGPATR